MKRNVMPVDAAWDPLFTLTMEPSACVVPPAPVLPDTLMAVTTDGVVISVVLAELKICIPAVVPVVQSLVARSHQPPSTPVTVAPAGTPKVCHV